MWMQGYSSESQQFHINWPRLLFGRSTWRPKWTLMVPTYTDPAGRTKGENSRKTRAPAAAHLVPRAPRRDMATTSGCIHLRHHDADCGRKSSSIGLASEGVRSVLVWLTPC